MYETTTANRWDRTARSLALAALLLCATACGGIVESAARPSQDAASGGKMPHGDGAGAGGASGAGAGGLGGAQPDCSERSSSDLPGVSLDVEDGRCFYTLAELAAGVSFDYSLSVEDTLAMVTAFPQEMPLACLEPDDESGLVISEEIRDAYCPLCDVGRCSPIAAARTAHAGQYAHTLPWSGRYWQGPSDTNAPLGRPVPPGSYELVLRAAGTWTPPGASEPRPFTVETRRGITVTP